MSDGSGDILAVSHLTRRFGGVTALSDVSFEVRAGEKLAVIGPNGAGKSTLLRLIAGQDAPTRGAIALDGSGRVDGKTAHSLARRGVALARQVPKPLRSLSVADNIRVGLAAGNARRTVSHAERLNEILDLTGLASKRDRPASKLPLLDLKRLEVARALGTEPKLLLLDEVSAGLNASDLDEAIALIAEIHRHGTSLMIVEHVQKVVHDLADRVIVLNWGSLIAEGTPAEVTANEEVGRIYLGSGRVASTTAAVDREARETGAVPGQSRDGLTLESVSARRGAIVALTDISISVRPGEIVTVLGANGAGKTSLTQVISGLLPASSGRVLWQGEDITSVPAFHRATARIAHCQEGRRLFVGLTVTENLELGGFRVPRAERDDLKAMVFDIFPVLKDRAKQVATTMSGGQQQMVAIGRALMAKPLLLLCDEVTLGLSPKVADEIYLALEQVAKTHTSMLLVEQDTDRSLAVASHAYLLSRGRVVYDGPPRALGKEQLLEAYLGT
ncbi:ATP-binding cassette domain-containing protein [uncultured Microbacterium sp.]|uniref:ATP-binding cassette domain-containing protein n=1 Tax=uncultured Microbacterium sp. TaxID=191216 RepID=UPI0035CC5D32